MSGKTIFIIIASVLLTVVLMHNTEEIDFWIFGVTRIPKLVILGSMFGIGFIMGAWATRPRKKAVVVEEKAVTERIVTDEKSSGLSDEDREYIG